MKKIIDFINNLGDYNHLFIGLIIMIAVSFTFPNLLYYASTFISAFYLGKEHKTYIKLGELGSFQINKWERHDRRQTIFVWVGVWSYAFFFSLT
jgi:hypothetical protein|tara:strand:- start:370 stop:651 length:282 start_codon:yes stop_codon:yes gene_type:complete